MKRLALVFLSAAALLSAVSLPPYTRQVLPNGLVLNVVPVSEVPLVSIRIVLRGGVESEPAGMSGLAEVTADALRRGTKTRTAQQFSLELDQLGATFRTGATMQSSYVAAEFLSKDLDTGLGLVMDALMQPAFPEDEVKKLLEQERDAARAMRDDPSSAASAYFRNFFFGAQHPYGTPPDENTLGAIDRASIAGYHRRMYVGRNMIVVVAGDIDPKTAAPKLAEVFSKIPAGSAYVWKKAEAPKIASTRLAIVDKPDATETQIRIGIPGIDRTHPDRVPLWLVNTLFGGRFTSILNDALRVESGLTYGASSSVEQNHLTGRISIGTFTATPNTAKAVDMALALMKKTAEQGLTAEQLESAKAYVKGTYPSRQLETSDQLADIISEIELFDLNRGEVDDLFSRIDAVTLERANQVLRRYLKPEGVAMLLLGNASAFPEEVKKYDPNPVRVPISAPGLRVHPQRSH